MMSDVAELLERESRTVDLEPGDFERLTRRRDRKRRNQRVAAGVLGIAVFALAAIGFVRLLGSERTPASDPRGPFLGVWVSTKDDGYTHAMTVRPSANGAVEIMVFDEAATLCSGGPSTMTGTGRIEAGTQLVIPAPVYTCEDGLEPEGLSGPPLQEQLRDWTLSLDRGTETLSDGFGTVWRREGALSDLEPLWPQTSFEEVRRAQELADAGDPRYTWQVHPDLGWQLGQHHPNDAELFARFLEEELGEELGWEEFLWDEAFAHPDGLVAGDVVYIRCAPGRTNPLYPADTGPGGCAPTIDDLRYETVKINAAQPVRQGPRGIWVVTGWEMIEPVAQADPRVVEAEATALLEDFLRARIDGAGAEEFADFPEYDPFPERVDREIPLLYATSAGTPYERSEFELVYGPVWPEGSMQLEVRLFAENGETVVEQVFSLERDETGRLRLVYDFEPEGPDGPVLATTENGKAVPVEYGFLDGLVTFRATYPLEPSQDGYREWDRLAIVGLLPDDDAPRRVVVFLADPRPIGPGCAVAPAPADAEAMARSIGSDPDFDATAPVAVTIGGRSALQMDVVLAPGASSCSWSEPEVSGSSPLLLEHAPFGGLDRARLYLLDLPGGSEARVLAIATITDEDSFATVLGFAAPIVDSIEFRAR